MVSFVINEINIIIIKPWPRPAVTCDVTFLVFLKSSRFRDLVGVRYLSVSENAKRSSPSSPFYCHVNKQQNKRYSIIIIILLLLFYIIRLSIHHEIHSDSAGRSATRLECSEQTQGFPRLPFFKNSLRVRQSWSRQMATWCPVCHPHLTLYVIHVAF